MNTNEAVIVDPACPRCGDNFSDLQALSRRDNHTSICNKCGTREAIEDAGMVPAYEGPEYWLNLPDWYSMLCTSFETYFEPQWLSFCHDPNGYYIAIKYDVPATGDVENGPSPCDVCDGPVYFIWNTVSGLLRGEDRFESVEFTDAQLDKFYWSKLS